MDISSKSLGKVAKKEARCRTPQEKKRPKEFSFVSQAPSQSPTLNGEDIQALAIRWEDLEKLRVPQPPKDSHKPPAMTRLLVRKPRPPEEDRRTVKVVVARPLPQDAVARPLEYTGPGGPRFDDQGMVLPHSILGSLEDFRREMETRGESELVKRVPDRPMAAEQNSEERPKPCPRGQPHRLDLQSHALQHWKSHMRERKRQLDFISHLLQKPSSSLLMSQSSHFRQIQEQREHMSRQLSSLHPGQGYRVGSEFWNIPQRIGDELSGITATLTQTQRGNPEPITRIGHPLHIQQETGNVLNGRSEPWGRSLYLKQCRQELREVLMDLDFSQPEIDGLEVIGTGQPFTSITAELCPLLEEEETYSEAEHKENQDPQDDDVMAEAVLVPALRFCGQPARWTGSPSSHKGELGIAVRLTFEALEGEQASSHLELQNEGSTALYYTWQHLPQEHSFPETQPPLHAPHFYFNTSTGVILPGELQRVEFIFKSDRAGIVSEVWCLHTHPVLLGGARLQVTLRGVALYQDRTAAQREALQKQLQHKEAEAVCSLLLVELLQGVRTPERPCTPAEHYLTEEDLFTMTNSQLYYQLEVVEELRRLWEQVRASGAEQEDAAPSMEPQIWDLSVPRLRQAVLALPEGDGDGQRDQALCCLNNLYLELQQPPAPPPPLLLHCIGLQLWRELLDGLVSEAVWLRQVMGLPENETQRQSQEERWKAKKEEKKGGPVSKEEKKGGSAKEEEKKGLIKQTSKEKLTEEGSSSKRKVREERRMGRAGKTPGKAPSYPPSPDPPTPELQERYRQQLHKRVYVLMESMVDSLCDLLEEVRSVQLDQSHLLT